MALCLVAAAMACSSLGCSVMGNLMTNVADCFEFRHDLRQEVHDERQELREELARVRQEERQKLKEAMLAEARADLAQLKQCLPETAPFTETTIALPLQQKYVFGPPELEVKEMEELIKAQKEGLEERMAQWRRDMKDYNDRKAFHDKNENKRVENFRITPKTCGCQQALVTGQCGCSAEQKLQCGCEEALRCGHCCCRRNCREEKTCEYAPQKKQPFTEKPPEMPRENILASELPLKMRVKVLQGVGESKVSKVRTGREPLHDNPRLPFKDQCDPGECTDGVPCVQQVGAGGLQSPVPPPPVVSEEPGADAETARRIPAAKPASPPVPPPDARHRTIPKFNIFGQK
ncbi:MAG: hypothetical protein ACKVP0_07530 [Pirellulaceae bacterium]